MFHGRRNYLVISMLVAIRGRPRPTFLPFSCKLLSQGISRNLTNRQRKSTTLLFMSFALSQHTKTLHYSSESHSHQLPASFDLPITKFTLLHFLDFRSYCPVIGCCLVISQEKLNDLLLIRMSGPVTRGYRSVSCLNLHAKATLYCESSAFTTHS